MSYDCEKVVKVEGRLLIGIILILILSMTVLSTYVKALISYHPNTVSQYAPPIVPNKAPVADPGPDLDAFLNETVLFDGSKSKDEDGKIVSYTWTFGDGNTATGIKVTHRYTSPGTYTATLKVTDDKKASGVDSIKVLVSEPTPEAIGSLNPERSATILEGLGTKTSSILLVSLNPSLAADIAEKMNKTILKNIVEVSRDLNQTYSISKILLEMENATGLLLDIDPVHNAIILESMLEINNTKCAHLVETAFSVDPNRTAAFLELVEAHALLKIIVAITRLPYTPSTAANILEALSAEKALELVTAWIAAEEIQELGNVLKHLSSNTLNNLFDILGLEERAILYPYLSLETISLIQSRLLPLSDITLTSLTIIRIGSRGYNVSVTIENQGYTSTGTFSMDLTINGGLATHAEFQDLPAGNSTATAFMWRPTVKGVYTLMAAVDPRDLITEVDEANNELYRTYGVELPDLWVTFRTTPSRLLEGKSQTFEVEVSNIGEEAAEDFNLTMRGSGIIIERGEVRWLSFVVGSSKIALLPTGSSEVISFVWKPEVAGAYTLEAKADPLEQVLEGDRTNNEATLQIEIEKGPAIWPYLLIGAVITMAAIVILLLRRPQVFSPLIRLFKWGM